MTRKHIVISGTGRAGTSFLVELLTHLGLETGYRPEDIAKHKCQTARAGLEHDIRRSDAPYIVKSPWFCDYADEVLRRDDISIERVLIPMRDLQAAAESRRFVTNAALSNMTMFKRLRTQILSTAVAGGVWHTSQATEQEAVLSQQIYKLLLSLSNTAIPVTLLRYPLLVSDASYLFRKLQPILGPVPQPEFEAVFQRIADPNLVHQFSQSDC